MSRGAWRSRAGSSCSGRSSSVARRTRCRARGDWAGARLGARSVATGAFALLVGGGCRGRAGVGGCAAFGVAAVRRRLGGRSRFGRAAGAIVGDDGPRRKANRTLALGEERDADHADVAILSFATRIRVAHRREAKRRNLIERSTKAFDGDLAVGRNDVAALVFVARGLAVDGVEPVDRDDASTRRDVGLVMRMR